MIKIERSLIKKMENQEPHKLPNLDESRIKGDKTEVLLEESKVHPSPDSIIGKLSAHSHIFPLQFA